MSSKKKEMEKIRDRVFVNNKGIEHTKAILDPHAFDGIDNSFSIESFKKGLSIKIIHETPTELVFDFIGVDAAIANALRRILIAEIPTMAIDRTLIFQNTSVMPDENLAHRLGLVPILSDARQFPYVGECEEADESNTLVFMLDVTCSANKDATPLTPDNQKYINDVVLSKDLKWIPQGNQAERFKDCPPRPVHDDIVLVKLRPRQSVQVEMHVEKGVGSTHAKWSPVCPATYRLLPEIVFKKPVTGKMAAELVAKCPLKVFDIEDIGGVKTAKASRPRDCTMCRECTREDPMEEYIELTRVRNHFIFQIESTGAVSCRDLFQQAIGILKSKAQNLLDQASESMH